MPCSANVPPYEADEIWCGIQSTWSDGSFQDAGTYISRSIWDGESSRRAPKYCQ